MYILIMRHFINPNPDPFPQQAFHITDGGERYYPHIDHATLQEISQTNQPRLIRQHAHTDVYHLVLYTRGQNDIALGGKRVSVGRGVLVPTGPGTGHTFSPLNPGQLAYHEITFSLRAADGICLTLPILKLLEMITGIDLPPATLPVTLNDGLFQDICRAFERLFAILRHPHVLQHVRIAGALANILEMLASSLFESFFNESVTDPEIARIRNYMKTHCGAPLDMGELARRAGMSRATFGRRFRARTGQSPLAYQNNLKIEAAKNLLRTTSLTLAEIATRLGYCDAYHFGRNFKQAVGVPPGRFRRRE